MDFTNEEVIFFGYWNDYEECGSLTICEKDGEYYSRHSGHSVMTGDFDFGWG